ncbi:hypothetical protein MJO28_001866 [Puccinia striiformis f. sp. tritici]|uniref:Uncharacterized protein n=1 Tax=Puccinia striiformis f. sp. tritici TaxID=168172 RepID=A0ACC0EVJ1_9BASI|nr:hypothetical protein MJO28_001866 [Puccinia striiformis f. sp. tritici]KAI7966176.1 hypothetical protein MJO29_001924 [Puccinia striiformis f. sp. tritici]
MVRKPKFLFILGPMFLEHPKKDKNDQFNKHHCLLNIQKIVQSHSTLVKPP